MTRTHSRIVPHGQCNSMPTGDAHQSTPAQLTGLALILSHSLRYTGYKTTNRQAFASTTRLETESIQIADLISVSIAPAPTFMPIMLSNAPPTSLLWFHQMYEGDTLRKTDRNCVWKQSNIDQLVAVATSSWWIYYEPNKQQQEIKSSAACIEYGGCDNDESHTFFRGNYPYALQVHSKDKSASQHIMTRIAGSRVINSLP